MATIVALDAQRRAKSKALDALTALVEDDLKAVNRTIVEDTWNHRYPSIAKAWRSAWEHVTPFLAYPPELRRVIYTTNSIEAL